MIPAIFLFIQPSFADVSSDAQKYKESQKYFDEGFNFYKLGQYEKAVESFKEAIRIRPYYADAYNWIGLSYGRLEQYEKAIEAYKEAIKLKPDYIEAQEDLGFAYFSSGKLDALEKKYDAQFRVVFDAIRQLMKPPEKHKRKIGFLRENEVQKEG